MNTLVSGEAYVTAISQASADRESRSAFQNLALSLVKPGGTLFDFGCGPGLDARVYAEHGLRVGAYDVDSDMRAYFNRHCAAQIASGTVRQNDGSYADFLCAPTVHGGVGVELITANFAPLNLVSDPRALFAKFGAMLNANGRVLVSVLNPTYFGDLKYSWWWRNAPRLCSRGAYPVAGAQAPITRYLPRRLAALALPALTLEAIYEGRLRSESWQALPPQLPAGFRSTLRLAACRFVFMQFRHRVRP